MPPTPKFDQAYPLAKRVVGVRAAQAARAWRLSQADREDLEQEAMLGLWLALTRFDPSRASLRTFTERVVANRISSELKARRTAKRTVTPAPPAASPTAALLVELRFDLVCALANVEPKDQRLALLLIDHTPSAASRVLSVSRSTVYEGIGRIRAALVAAGLEPRRKTEMA